MVSAKVRKMRPPIRDQKRDGHGDDEETETAEKARRRMSDKANMSVNPCLRALTLF